MTVHQLPADIAAFTGWLSELAGRLEPGQGWYGVFAARDPEGMRACFGGTDILPWDVVESLLQDLGEPADGPRALRGRALHRAAAAAHDQGPGGAAALTERRALMAEEIRYAEQRIRELSGRPDPDGALYWAQDDHTRATARVAELTERLERLQRLERPEPPEPVRRRPRGARYAWVAEEAEPVVNPVGAPAAGPVPAAAPLAAPRGARFAPVPADPAPTADAAPAPAPDEAARAARAAGNAVYALRRLRAQGRTGEAHALLCEALAGPPEWLPALAEELAAAGLAADWSTLLWEAADLPPARLAAVAVALADAGRADDRDRLLRQGAARPVAELAGACAALRAVHRDGETHALLGAFLGLRAPEDAAALAAADPAALVPELRAAARAVSPARERDLLHALRVAGLA
ncbi:UL36 very large tegument protein [Streptomyces sp. SKN60]|uniref:UL36 very large tegument protein n=1 Tax=Streptomyces sp. SKN60 TaxID=2855506 RepID=UPI002246F672|nr:UL36 very large tegument protein [Streptomyces sp. SKN60]MCX2184663.1 UL36 very large tegument protein [Streptomyces sp. SKN60]